MELKVIGRGAGSFGDSGAVDVLGVVGTTLGPTDGADDTAVGEEGVGKAEVDIRFVGTGTEPCVKLH